jgi:hypothetical protein
MANEVRPFQGASPRACRGTRPLRGSISETNVEVGTGGAAQAERSERGIRLGPERRKWLRWAVSAAKSTAPAQPVPTLLRTRKEH